ncbi:MAG: hypothetical protein C5B51_08420 [Terriglobia bacterium]|nr:MAG: hypothetical protein C5B51_08420 [Terriglobia bacterium]
MPCLAVAVLCLFAAPLIRQQIDALVHAPLDYPPQVLQQKARDIASSFGYPKKPADSAFWLDYRRDLLTYLKDLPEPRKYAEWLAAEAPIAASYRESQSPLHAPPFGDVQPDNPAPTEPGMLQVILDGNGRLREFSAVPFAAGDALAEPVPPELIFRAAGLDRAAFVEVSPKSVPASPADQLHAWKGSHPSIPNADLLVEMGSWKGRVTFAKVNTPWDKPLQAQTQSPWLGRLLLSIVVLGLFFTTLLARRNWRLGRADRRGAVRLGAVRFLLGFAVWIGTVHALPDTSLATSFFESIGDWLLSAALLWIMYLALEPELRARWPHSIVTWNRLLAGRWRDAQVGAHILIGATVGALIWVGADLVELWFGKHNVLGPEGGVAILLGSRAWFATVARDLGSVLYVGLILFLCMFGVRQWVRKDVLAALVAAAVAVPFNFNGHFNDWQVLLPVYFVLFAALAFVLLRLGLVAAFAAVFFIDSFGKIVIGADWTTWYAPYGIAQLTLLLSIVLFAFWRSLGSRELLARGVDA